MARALDLARRAGQVERYVTALGKLIDAEAKVERAVALLTSLGLTLERDAHDDARAAEAYVRAEQLLTGHPEASREPLPAIRRALAGVYERLGDTSAEEAVHERQLEAGGPDVADAHYRLAGLRLHRPETLEDGLAMLDRAFDLSPDPDRMEALLRGALFHGADSVAIGHALAQFARRTERWSTRSS